MFSHDYKLLDLTCEVKSVTPYFGDRVHPSVREPISATKPFLVFCCKFDMGAV